MTEEHTLAGVPLRIVSYNVRYFGHALRGLASTRRSKRAIAEALASLIPAADIVCLQEVETISLRSRLAFRKGHEAETQLEAFMGELEQAYDKRQSLKKADAQADTACAALDSGNATARIPAGNARPV